MIRIEDGVYVAPQVTAEVLTNARAEGIRLVLCNRPDGEEPSQPSHEDVREWAEAEGLGFHYLPISGMLHDEQVDHVKALLEEGTPFLAYCASGTRSTFLWAAASAARGKSPEAIIAAAGAAGYDLSALRARLQSLASRP